MKIEVWRFRSLARNHVRSLAVVLVVLAFVALLGAQQLRPAPENGRVVWTNDDFRDDGAPSSVSASHAARRPTQLVYWSNVEQRWKEVRPANPRALRSARVVAGEVSSYIQSHPLLDSNLARNKGALAGHGPSNSRTAGNTSAQAAEIDRYIDAAAARHHVDPNLVRALVKVESNFNPRARSNKGAMGLMQLMPATARMYDVQNPFDAAQNVDAGVRHLKGLLDNFGGNVSLSLAAYNAGQGAVERNRGIPPYAETRNYVQRITDIMGSGSESRFGSLSVPIHVHRDERGILVISNTD
jgi:soluble lytic murein transglycosylase-like protein